MIVGTHTKIIMKKHGQSRGEVEINLHAHCLFCTTKFVASFNVIKYAQSDQRLCCRCLERIPSQGVPVPQKKIALFRCSVKSKS